MRVRAKLRSLRIRAGLAAGIFRDAELPIPGRYPLQGNADLLALVQKLGLPTATLSEYPAEKRRSGTDRTTTWSSESDVTRTLHWLTRQLQPEAVIEVGTYRGATSIGIVAGLKANGRGVLYGVDYSETLLSETERYLREAGYGEQFRAVAGRSADPATLAKLPGKADLIFIDASHKYEDVRNDFRAYGPLLSARGIMGFHDTANKVGPRRTMLDVLATPGWRVISLSTSGGSGLSFAWHG